MHTNTCTVYEHMYATTGACTCTMYMYSVHVHSCSFAIVHCTYLKSDSIYMSSCTRTVEPHLADTPGMRTSLLYGQKSMPKLYVSLCRTSKPPELQTPIFSALWTRSQLLSQYLHVHTFLFTIIADRSFQSSTSRCLIPGILGIPLYS